jgi:hypothetical protein
MHADIFVDTDNQTDRMLSSVLWVMEKMEVEITSVHLFGAGSGNGMAHWVEAWRRQAGTVNVVTYKTAGRDHLGLETLMTGAVRTVEADSTASSLCLLVTDNVELLNAVHRNRSASDHRLMVHISGHTAIPKRGRRCAVLRPGAGSTQRKQTVNKTPFQPMEAAIAC